MTGLREKGSGANRIHLVEQIVLECEATSRQRTTEVLGVRLVWHQWGDINKPPLLLMHGGAGSWKHWLRNIAALAKDYWLIVPDLPGLGESAMPQTPNSADQLAELIGLGLDQIVDVTRAVDIASYSFGGVVSGHLASLRPSRVNSLALVGAVGLSLSRNERPKFLRVDPDLPVLERWKLQAKNMVPHLISNQNQVDDLATHLQDIHVRQTRLRSSILSNKETLGPILRSLDIPIAAAWGEADSIYAGQPHEERIKAIMRLRHSGGVYFIKNAGHWAAFEQPEAYAAWLLDWLSRKGNKA